MGEIFKLADIKAGYLLQVKDLDSGDVFNMTVVPGRGTPKPKNAIEFIILTLMAGHESTRNLTDGDLVCCCPEHEHFWPLAYFGDGLRTPRGKGMFEIVAVYGYAPAKTILANNTDRRELLWQREAAEAADA